MTDKKQIMEMVKDVPYLTLDRTVFVGATETKNVSWMLSEEDNKVIAESLVAKGWIKTNKDSIVLSREEYQKDFSSQFNKGYEKGSKETAREICLKIIKGQPQPIQEKWIEWFKKEYGVEVE